MSHISLQPQAEEPSRGKRLTPCEQIKCEARQNLLSTMLPDTSRITPVEVFCSKSGAQSGILHLCKPVSFAATFFESWMPEHWAILPAQAMVGGMPRSCWWPLQVALPTSGQCLMPLPPNLTTGHSRRSRSCALQLHSCQFGRNTCNSL